MGWVSSGVRKLNPAGEMGKSKKATTVRKMPSVLQPRMSSSQNRALRFGLCSLTIRVLAESGLVDSFEVSTNGRSES